MKLSILQPSLTDSQMGDQRLASSDSKESEEHIKLSGKSLMLERPMTVAAQLIRQRVAYRIQTDFPGFKRAIRHSRPQESRPGNHKDNVQVAIENSEAFRNMTEHRIPLSELLNQVHLVDIQAGLTEAQASRRLLEEGENVLTQQKQTPWYVLFLKQLVGFFSLLLWTGSILSFIAYDLTSDPQNLYLSIVIAICVLVTATISFYQEAKSRAIMESFKNFTPPKCTVLREGVQRTLPAARLVRGDVVLLKGGDRIPADLRIVQSQEMKVDNAALTGESEQMQRKPECTHPDNPFETQNLAFLGTMCVDGTGSGIVINVGDATFMGRIASLVHSAESNETTLAKEIDRFVKMISGVAFGIGGTFFILGLMRGYGVIDSIVFMIGIIVANVPEGLLATVTVGLTLTAKRMARKQVLVKSLESVETLGSTTCICSDKTGTLTQNLMTVSHLWYDQKIVEGKSLEIQAHPEYDVENPSFKILQKCAVLCNDAGFDEGMPASLDLTDREKDGLNQQEIFQKQEEKWQKYRKDLHSKPFYQRPTTSNASEGALIKFFHPIEYVETSRKRQESLYCGERKIVIPFSSATKYQVSVQAPATWQPAPHQSDYLLLMKGAPEFVMALSTMYCCNGESKPIDERWLMEFAAANRTFGEHGERVLAFAYRYLSISEFPPDFAWEVSPPNFPINELIFIGLISLQDPPRPGVSEAVLTCQQAGIKVIMVTGDQSLTALAIARQCNIITRKTANEAAEEQGCSFEDVLDDYDSVVIHGSVLAGAAAEDKWLPEEKKGLKLKRWLSKPEIVFARTTPAQKLIIVEGNQHLGHIVAVTGDGVNDSPAIKKADIGIAMNLVGSDVAKDAADMLLLDDNFASIVQGVEEGRLIFDNLKKSIVYTLSSNIPELGPFLSFIVFQFPLPLTIILVLFVDLCTDMLPAISLAYESAEDNIMTRKPRDAEVDRLVTWKLLAFGYAEMGVIEMFAGFYTYFVVMHDYGFSVEVLFGMAMNSEGAQPSETDKYDPSDIHRGNSNWDNPTYTGKIVDWVSDSYAHYDLRIWFWKAGPWTSCNYDTSSAVVSGVPVCYSTEALKSAQTAFFLSIIAAQMATLLCIKTRILSFTKHGFENVVSFYGIVSEVAIGVLITFTPVLNLSLNTRPVEWLHLFVPATPFCMFLLCFDEVRKCLLRRNLMQREDPGWLEKFTLW